MGSSPLEYEGHGNWVPASSTLGKLFALPNTPLQSPSASVPRQSAMQVAVVTLPILVGAGGNVGQIGFQPPLRPDGEVAIDAATFCVTNQAGTQVFMATTVVSPLMLPCDGNLHIFTGAELANHLPYVGSDLSVQPDGNIKSVAGGIFTMQAAVLLG